MYACSIPSLRRAGLSYNRVSYRLVNETPETAIKNHRVLYWQTVCGLSWRKNTDKVLPRIDFKTPLNIYCHNLAESRLPIFADHATIIAQDDSLESLKTPIIVKRNRRMVLKKMETRLNKKSKTDVFALKIRRSRRRIRIKNRPIKRNKNVRYGI